MLPLGAEIFPDSHAALEQALRDGLSGCGVAVREVSARGGVFPALKSLLIDVTGAELTRASRLPTAKSAGSLGVQVQRLELVGEPIQFEDAHASFRLHAESATLGFARSSDGKPLLTLSRAERGAVTFSVARGELELLLTALARKAATEHGVEIKKTALSFETTGPRALKFRAEVAAKMFVMSATVTLSGTVTVDDQLNARVSGLTLGGDGMIVKLAGGFLRPHLDKLEGRIFPLMAVSLGGVTLRDVQIEAGETLRVSAQFAS